MLLLIKNGRIMQPRAGDRIAVDTNAGCLSYTRNGFPFEIRVAGTSNAHYVFPFEKDERNGVERTWWLLDILDHETELGIRSAASTDPNVECFELFNPSEGDAT